MRGLHKQSSNCKEVIVGLSCRQTTQNSMHHMSVQVDISGLYDTRHKLKAHGVN